ncbi:hypothetical protein [Mammaliicoccus sciuri]|uniref:hypothetical protein n=1 Tax=Mammaliicoccus sciuri TaxID=1296 RepID=UPI001FB3ABD0|nr:hypothetical protein [Mammaliicoccus sciuri]MCJ0969775.1 hypothetical protein [Mammaliicoccus sciuri]
MINQLAIRYKQPFHEDNIMIAENHNVPKVIYRSRILNGWNIDEAIHVFPSNDELQKNNLRSDDLKFTGSHIDNLNRILIHEEEKRRQVYKEKYSKPKPWIEKYPQKTEFEDYAQLLFQECCGSWSK